MLYIVMCYINLKHYIYIMAFCSHDTVLHCDTLKFINCDWILENRQLCIKINI